MAVNNYYIWTKQQLFVGFGNSAVNEQKVFLNSLGLSRLAFWEIFSHFRGSTAMLLWMQHFPVLQYDVKTLEWDITLFFKWELWRGVIDIINFIKNHFPLFVKIKKNTCQNWQVYHKDMHIICLNEQITITVTHEFKCSDKIESGLHGAFC